MRPGFDRRIFTAKTFVSDIGFLVVNTPNIIGALRKGRVDRAFMERIMTVITAVNGCVYCSWFHAIRAVSSGISAQEVRDLFNLQFHSNATEFELPGLVYAQHYAETNRQPDIEMDERLVGYYGDQTARDITLFIRMIFFGNLAGNTWDAALSRFKGRPAGNSSIVFELLFLVLTVPAMIPLMFLTRDARRARLSEPRRTQT